ncbi:helix-turn-helix transcriptional regulator [Paenibacillus terrigena]|uniref:helix-turn-helix transcriptional regulator n=1 Tax=Paenibacillus terrigena TaxID=369333 RepID=UPI00036D26C1|nr:AraC family transcriptional regulator [Paenibacillus terrigena]
MSSAQEIAAFHHTYNNYVSQLGPVLCTDGGIETMTIPSAIGEGLLARMKLRDGMEMITSSYRLAQDKVLDFRSAEPAIELTFCLKGRYHCGIQGREIIMLEHECRISIIQQVHAVVELVREIDTEFLELRMELSLMKQYLEGVGLGQGFDIQRWIGQQGYRMVQHPMDAHVERLLYEIRHCDYPQPLRKMVLESKMLELFAYYLQRYVMESSVQESAVSVLRHDDRDRILHARDVLLAHMDHPPSTIEMARIVGLNDYKLKAGFKEVFGTTLFGYLRNQRLEHAMQLLQQGGMNVGEAACAVGYSNPSHFTVAFRKRYGVNPGEMIARK